MLPSHPALGLLQLEHAELFHGFLVPVLDFGDALVAFLQLGVDGRVVDLVALDGLVDVPDLCVHARQGLLAFLDLAAGGVGPFGFLADLQRERTASGCPLREAAPNLLTGLAGVGQGLAK